MPNIEDDKPLDGPTNRFIQWYIDTRDIDQTVKILNITKARGLYLYKHPRVRAEIDHGINAVDHEAALLRAKARVLTSDKLDESLIKSIETETGMVRVRATELGYKRLGLLKEKAEITGENGGPVVFTLERIGGKE